MYHTGMWRQRAGSAKISLCQLVDRWEHEDGGQIRVLISFHQLWIPAELKVNIWGFSKPSRCLESMDWLVLAAPLSGFVGRPGPISNVSQLHLSQRLPGQNHYTLYCIPLSRSSFILFFLSPFVYICHTVGFVTPCDTWCELSVGKMSAERRAEVAYNLW